MGKGVLSLGTMPRLFAWLGDLQRDLRELLVRAAMCQRMPQLSQPPSGQRHLLLRAVLQLLGPERVHPGHHLARFGQNADCVWADFVNRVSGAPRAHVEADVLVGCDGIHSVVRQAVFPHEGPPQWNGITMWCAVTEGAPFLSGRTMVLAGYFARQMVVYPISRRHEAAGKALINWVAGVKNAPEQPMPPQDWEHTALREDVLKPFMRLEATALSGFGLLFGVSFDGGHRELLQTYARNAR